MRLDKYLCESTELTRSQAKRALRSGGVACNGVIEKSGAFKVPDGAEIWLEGRLLQLRGLRYIMVNKPDAMLCSNVDEEYPSVLSLLDVDKARSMHIAGRLDADTTGLVLVTDDGQWSHRITSPGKACGKRYRVQLADPVAEVDMRPLIEQFAEGIQLKGETGLTRPAQLEMLSPKEALLTLFEGKYHQVKRMFAAMGNKVVGLHREQVGAIKLDSSLALGEWRHLTEDEIQSV